MTQSITLYVDVNVTTQGPELLAAGLDTMILVLEHAIDAPARQLGPFGSPDDVVDAGFPTGGVAHEWAIAVFGQLEHVDQVYIGRRDALDADLTASLVAIKDENPGAAYGWTIATRTDEDILELAAWIRGEAFGIAIGQSSATSLLNGTGPVHEATVGGTATDGDYELEFDGGDLVAPVPITVTRVGGVPATNAALATALAAAIVAEIGVGGDLEGVVTAAEADGEIVRWTAARGLSPVVTVIETAPAPGTLVDAIVDSDVGGQLFALQETRLALVYHADDAAYLDGAWMSAGLAFDLDVQKGIWAYKRVVGITGDNLSNAQVVAIRSVNANYFAPAVMSSGLPVQAFTAQGWVPFGEAAAGRRIDIVTTIDWSKARLEEDLFGAILRAPRGIPFTDAGINVFDTVARGRLQKGVSAGHYLGGFIVPEGDASGFAGLVTPSTVNVPRLSDLTSAQRASRELSFGALAYLAQAIERVVFSLNLQN